MRKRFWLRTKVVFFLGVNILICYSEMLGANQASQVSTGKESEIPAEFAVTITGRILSQDKEPLVGMSVLVSETDKDKIAITWRTGDDGKVLNPIGETDKTGRFTIVADRRFWEKTGYLTLQGGFIPGTTKNAGILRGAINEPLIIKLDPKTKKLDLGEIVVSTE